MFKGRERKEELLANTVKLGHTQVTVKSVTKSSTIIELTKINSNIKCIIKINNRQAKDLMDAIDGARIFTDIRKEINIVAAKAKHVFNETNVVFHESSKAKIIVIGLAGHCTLAIVDEYNNVYYAEAFPICNYADAFRNIRGIVNDMRFEMI